MDSVSKLGLTVAWAVTFAVVLVFGFGVTDWHLIATEILDGNTSDIIAFTAGYTLPLTGGIFASLGLLLLNGHYNWGIASMNLWIAVGLILFGSGLLSNFLGLGLAPEFTMQLNGPPWISFLVMALIGYFNTYGWPLMLCSAAIAITAILHVAYWINKPDAIIGDLTG